jgi:5-carboxymethyl-2-hydroxymuconate isomerase
MPHLTIEYTANLENFDAAKALAALNQVMVNTGLFHEPDIKNRAIRLDIFQAGVVCEPRAFVHLRVGILSGRSGEERKHMADALLPVLNATVHGAFSGEIQLSVETIEIDRPSYAKAIVHGR